MNTHNSSTCRASCVLAAFLLLAASFTGCGPVGRPGPIGKAILARIAVEAASELVMEVLDNYQGEPYIPPGYIHQYESIAYYVDRQTGLMIHANRLGGLNYWTPQKTLVGFSAYHAPSQEFHYFDGWGSRIY